MKTISDDTLRSTRERLISRSAELTERLRRIRADLARTREPLPRDSGDAAIVVENDEVLQALEEGAQLEITRIERALARLDSGAFAICEECGEQIEEERLNVIPFASHCRRCAPDA
jgi:DnaK suppressor protein